MRFALTLFTLITSTFAYNITLFETAECEGKSTNVGLLGVGDGCQKLDGAMSGLGVGWSGDDDNELVLMTFGDENCCNGIAGTAMGWSADCQGVATVVTKSFRVMDPNDINKGKEGQNYECSGS